MSDKNKQIIDVLDKSKKQIEKIHEDSETQTSEHQILLNKMEEVIALLNEIKRAII